MVDRAYQFQYYTTFHFQFFKNVFSRLYEIQLLPQFLKNDDIHDQDSTPDSVLVDIASLKIRNTLDFFSSHLLLRF